MMWSPEHGPQDVDVRTWPPGGHHHDVVTRTRNPGHGHQEKQLFCRNVILVKAKFDEQTISNLKYC